MNKWFEEKQYNFLLQASLVLRQHSLNSDLFYLGKNVIEIWASLMQIKFFMCLLCSIKIRVLKSK